MMVQLRTASPADAEAMLAVARSLPQWFTEGGVQEMARDFPIHQGVVAVDQEGRVVGFVTFAPSPHTPQEGLVEMTWLGVSPEYRRHGVGRLLVAALESECRQAGADVVQVSTLADTVEYEPYAETRAFYRRLGFSDWRVDPGFYDGDDRLLLRKAL
ncbi:MAG: GNAT family N-acetyltransferase [Mycobacterium leprae]